MITNASTYPNWDSPIRVNGCFPLDLRVKNLAEAHSSKQAMASFMSRCKNDGVFFANNCVDTFNPQMIKTKNRPMLLCLRQEEAIEHALFCETNDRDSVWPKTRKVGESWMLGAVYPMWRWLFEDGWAGLVGSRSRDLVEKGEGDMDTLFAKFDFVEKNLPPFMRIKEYGAVEPWKVQGLRKNPLSGAQYKGEAVTTDFGAGPRASFIMVDELSKCTYARQAWYSAGQTSQSKHGVFTPNGKEFAWSLTFPGQAEKEWGSKRLPKPLVFRISYKDIPWYNRFHIYDTEAEREIQWKTLEQFYEWSDANKSHIIYSGNGYSPMDYVGVEPDGRCLADHIPVGMGYDDGRGNFSHLSERRPLENMPVNGVSVVYPWREIEGLKYDEVYAARELDISFEQSRTGLVYSIQMERAPKEFSLVRKPEYPLYGICDPGGSKGNEFYLGFCQWNWQRRMYEFLREISFEGRSAYYLLALLTGNPELLHYAVEEKMQHEYEVLWDEFQDPMWRTNGIYADPMIIRKDASARETVKGIFNRHGIWVRAEHEWKGFETRIPAARRLLRYSSFDVARTPKLISALTNIYYNDEDINGTSVVAKNGYFHHPVWSHPCAAFEYMACGDPHRWDNKDNLEHTPENRIMTAEEFNRREGWAYDKIGKPRNVWTPGQEGSGW